MEGCAITVESGQRLENQGTISGGSLIIKSNSVENTGIITDCAITSKPGLQWVNEGNISGGSLTIIAGRFENGGSISGCDIDVNTSDSFRNSGSISDCDIDVNTGGNFENNSGATISGGTLDIIRYGGLCTNSGTITGEITVSIQSGVLTNYGTISGGKYTIETDCTLNNYNTISGGTFSGNGRIYWLDSTISGGTFNCVLAGGASNNTGIVSKAHINGDIHYGGIFENTCIFGDGAYVWNDFQGTIKLSVTADGKTKDINYGANVLQSLDTPPEGKGWALKAADGQTTLVGANDTMPLLKNNETRTYVLIDLTNINDLEIAAIDSQTYAGAAITPGVTITDGDKQLAAGTNYTVAYKDNINVGTATATITGIGLYTGSVEKTFQINKAKAPKIIWPTASSITYGQMLADSTLTSADAHGTFDWEDKTIAPEVGAHGYNVIYTPSDTENYDYTDVTRIQQVSITVTAKNIADESIAATIPEQTYTGEARTPEVAVTDGAHTLAANTDYTVAYSNNINAGTATATLTGMGNYTGTRTVKFTIQPQAAALNVLSAERTWSKDMSLNESDLRALFTVNDASGKALDGGLYTIAVTKDGATASLPIEDAGAYTVKVTLTDGNYSLSKDSFPYTIAKLPFSGTVNMSGYAYGGTVSQPVLSGYAGDGTITYYYRAKDAANWTEWTNIAADTLTPGDYEIRAIVADATNYAGSETEPVKFIVAPGKLAASIAMQDYTYGGTVFEPKLESTVTGLDVAWFYKGADGEEHPWENITGTTLTAGGYTIIARIEASALYEAAELTSTFTVNKAAAPEIDWPEVAQGIVYGQKVADIALSAAEDGYGAFAWQDPDAILNAGEQTATLVYAPRDTDNYDYTGVELTREIAISIAPRDVYTLAAAPIPAQTYTGGPIYPAVSLWHGETKLVMGVDYTLSYQGNVNVGVGIITVSGMGNYAGTRLLFFDIVPPRAEEEEKPSGGSGGSTGNGGETAESTGEAQQDRLVVDTTGAAMPYTYSTVEELEEATGALLARTLVIVADPVRDETGAIVYDADGQPLYEARSLLLSRELLDAIAERGYTHIRFVVKDAALEWPLASMTGDGYTVRLAPLEEEELSQAEKDAIGALETLTGSYRARVTAVIEGEEVDVTNAIPSLTAIFGAQSVRELADGETAQLLLVPGDGKIEAQVAAAQYIEETQAEEARYEVPLWESGLFVLTLQ